MKNLLIILFIVSFSAYGQQQYYTDSSHHRAFIIRTRVISGKTITDTVETTKNYNLQRWKAIQKKCRYDSLLNPDMFTSDTIMRKNYWAIYRKVYH